MKIGVRQNHFWACLIAVSLTFAVFLLLDIYPFRRLSLNSAKDHFHWRNFAIIIGEKVPLLPVSFISGMWTIGSYLQNDLAVPIQKIGWEPRMAQPLVTSRFNGRSKRIRELLARLKRL